MRTLLAELERVEEQVAALRQDLAVAEQERAQLHRRLVVTAGQALDDTETAERSAATEAVLARELPAGDPPQLIAPPDHSEVSAPVAWAAPAVATAEVVEQKATEDLEEQHDEVDHLLSEDDLHEGDDWEDEDDDEDDLEEEEEEPLLLTSDVESWLLPAVHLGDDAPLDFSALEDGRTRLVSLSEVVTGNVLRRHLPHGWAIQPDGDQPEVRTALVYRPTAPIGGHDGMLGRAFACVDALALLDSSGTLDPELHEALVHHLADLRDVSPSHREHLEARAQWRRSEPATSEAVRSYVTRAGSRGSRHLAEWLTTLVSEDSPYFEAMTVLTSALLGTAATESSVEVAAPVDSAVVDEFSEQIDPATTEAPAAEAAGTTGSMDFGRIAALRLNAERARAALEGLAPEDDGDADTDDDSAPLVDSAVILDAATTALFLQLVSAEVHAIDDVRTWARDLDLVPLSALQRINDWAERRMEDRGTPLDVPLIEVDDPNRAVWVDDSAKELLS
ncbi:hypothetical protein GTR02_00260 [Kineococcus sp. R8]|uniref:tellurite resistance TerB C-terminal domain-containing protein n=1 Tax=Kineococcus siccus TaxID=2696567 RepID=UPI0014128BFF|nr:tellurite resistance TerB C-terminal domain-containing protein [Kineococcus siccus]NAZ80254.1 hypothetical protein [Kineococcus siccus]